MQAVVALAATAMLAAPVYAASCDPEKATSSVSFSKSIEPLLADTCASMTCHYSHGAAADLVLNTGAAYHFLVGQYSVEARPMRIVEPGDPEASYIIHKLRGTQEKAGGGGERMPWEAPPLAEKDIAMIATWIKDCTPRN